MADHYKLYSNNYSPDQDDVVPYTIWHAAKRLPYGEDLFDYECGIWGRNRAAVVAEAERRFVRGEAPSFAGKCCDRLEREDRTGYHKGDTSCR